MKRVESLGLFFVLVIMLLPIRLGWAAQMSAKMALPQVPITYPGDTEETIKRRAQWIEGAKKEGKLEWWGTARTDEAIKVIAEFNKIYPFITVNYWSGKGEEKAAMIEADFVGKNFSVDIASGTNVGPHYHIRWRQMGMLEKFTDIIPGVQRFDKRMFSRYNDWALPGHNGTTPAYNTKVVPAAETPKSWEDLLNPKWKGQIALTTDVKMWLALALEEGGWGVEKTENFLERLKQQQLIWAKTYIAGHTLLVSGDFKILGLSFISNTVKAQEKAAPVEWSRVRPVIVSGPAIIFLKKAPHPNAAKLLLEWLFSPAGLLTYEKITYYGLASPGSGTQLAKALEGLPLVYRTEEGEMKAVDMDLEKRFLKILGVTLD